MNLVTKEQSDMIDEILLGRTISDIAKNVLKLHPSTLYRWLDKPNVKLELEERRKALRKSARDKITGNVLNYLDNMIDMANNSTDMRVKYNANKYLLDQCIGAPTTAKEDKTTDATTNTTPAVDLKKEIEALKVIK